MRQRKVFGDIMVDEWVYGKLSKYSVEAPIKIFTTNKLDYSLGGVGNLKDIENAFRAGADAVAAGAFFVYHGPHRAVLISYPKLNEIEKLSF